MTKQKNSIQILKNKLHQINFSTTIKKKRPIKEAEFKRLAKEARKTFKDEDIIRSEFAY